MGAGQYKQPLLFVSFGIYLFSIIFSAIRLKKKFSAFIGVTCFSTTVGIVFKKIGIVDKVIFYSIDYAVPMDTDPIQVPLFPIVTRMISSATIIGL